VLSVSKEPNGIDIEPIKKNFSLNSSMIKMVCTENEFQILATLPWDKKKEMFLQFWVKKEAFLKAIGFGLYGDIRNIDVSGADYNLLNKENDANNKINFYKIDIKHHICYVAYDTKIPTSYINIHNNIKLF
jgi:phosphopantetheine--protein transferase-like protein